MRHQVSALPYRLARVAAGSPEVLLITSSSGRWIIPKGDVDPGMQPHQAAKKEAFEEGGVRGQIADRPIGRFETCKEENGAAIPLEVEVFPMEVSEELDRWPEMDVRDRRWLRAPEAAEAVDHRGLAAIIRSFRPS